MFKIEYLFSYNLPFRVGYCMYIEFLLRFSSASTFRVLKKINAVMLHFLMHICIYRITRSINS